MIKEAFKEVFRPQFHFTPAANWMNDPNGMVYYQGEYHLCYQYHPNGTTWGPMHWGHAVSKDLVHWEHLPVALEPDENGFVFSGSVVVDYHDTSGFFSGGSGLVAIFTHADTYPNSETPRQRQSIAYSLDKGRTWEKYEGNPVLSDEEIIDFRDPKVIWHEGTKKWTLVLAAGDHIRIYLSSNLKEWSFASQFGKDEGSHDGVWECPDLFELPVDGDEEYKKWVLIVSLGDNPNIPEGSRTQYFIGDFDGETYSNDHSKDTILWLDHGRDNYAGVTWSDMTDGRRVFIGWMSNWKYANVTPTSTWRSAMTIPRTLSLSTFADDVRLTQQPVEEIRSLRQEKYKCQDRQIEPGQNLLSDVEGDLFEIVAEFEVGNASEFGFKLRKSAEEETVVGYNALDSTLYIDRERSGIVDFNPAFGCMHDTQLRPDNRRIQMQIFLDWSSIEVFANKGKLVMTDLIFPDSKSQGLELFSVGGSTRLIRLEVYTLESIYKSRQSSKELHI